MRKRDVLSLVKKHGVYFNFNMLLNHKNTIFVKNKNDFYMMICIDWIAVGSIATAVVATLTFISMILSSKQYKRQQIELNNQIEENRYLQLLNVFKENRQSLSIVNNKGELFCGVDSFQVAIDVFNSSNEYYQNGSPNNATRFYLSYGGLLNANSYYDSMLCLLDYVEHSSNKEHYYSVFWNSLGDYEKKWLDLFLHYCSKIVNFPFLGQSVIRLQK